VSATPPDFELSVRLFSSTLYRYAYWLSRNRSDAEDLVQECFHKAWKSWHTLHDEHAVKHWLFTILRNEYLRRFSKKQPEMVSMEVAENIFENLHAVVSSPDEIYAIQQAIHQAPPALRDTLLLQVLGGFSCDEIAQMQNTTSGAVMTRLSRARQWFRSRLRLEAPNDHTGNML
jgi:RNA polymerase sigma-70 factor, ECF subfamily